jgi:hypothetical protein
MDPRQEAGVKVSQVPNPVSPTAKPQLGGGLVLRTDPPLVEVQQPAQPGSGPSSACDTLEAYPRRSPAPRGRPPRRPPEGRFAFLRDGPPAHRSPAPAAGRRQLREANERQVRSPRVPGTRPKRPFRELSITGWPRTDTPVSFRVGWYLQFPTTGRTHRSVQSIAHLIAAPVHSDRMRPALLAPLTVALLAVCGCSATSPGSSALPGDVTAARIDWQLPSPMGRVPPSTLTEAAARSLIRAINAAPAWPDGRYN